MNCPKCEENALNKIQFLASKKVAYLCTNCNAFWLSNEHIDVLTGHLLDESRDDMHSDKAYTFIDEEDKGSQEVKDEKEREAYELL